MPFVPKSVDATQAISLQKEILSIKTEMNATSAQDDFARWAKLRRQFDRKTEQYKALSTFTACLLLTVKF
jgi:tail-anchored protein insertion receptor